MAKAIPVQPPLRPNTIVLFGDSITNSNTGSATGVQALTRVRFFQVANAIAGQRLNLAANAGISGNSTAQMLARLGSDVLAYRPGYAHVLGGTNDPASSIAYGDVATPGSTIWNLFQIYQRLHAAGIFLFIGTISTRQDYASNSTQSRHNAFVNQFIRWYCRTYPGCALVDYAYALSDPATGRPNSAWVDASDGIGVHPQDMGGMLMGMALAEQIMAVVPASDDAPGTLYDHTNMVLNPMCQGNNADGTNGWKLNGAGSGTGPNGFGAYHRNTGTGVYSSAVARAGAAWPYLPWRQDTVARVAASFTAANDGVGFLFGGDEIGATNRYDRTWAAATAFTYGEKRNPTAGGALIAHLLVPGTTGSSEPAWPTIENAQVTDGTVTWIMRRKPQPGDQYYAQCDVYLSGLSGGAQPVLELLCIDTTGTAVQATQDWYHDLSGGSGGYPAILPAGMIRLRTPVMTIPSFGANALRYLRGKLMAYGTAGGAVTMDMARCAIMRVSP